MRSKCQHHFMKIIIACEFVGTKLELIVHAFFLQGNCSSFITSCNSELGKLKRKVFPCKNYLPQRDSTLLLLLTEIFRRTL